VSCAKAVIEKMVKAAIVSILIAFIFKLFMCFEKRYLTANRNADSPAIVIARIE
jgi:hypothetical protein